MCCSYSANTLRPKQGDYRCQNTDKNGNTPTAHSETHNACKNEQLKHACLHNCLWAQHESLKLYGPFLTLYSTLVWLLTPIQEQRIHSNCTVSVCVQHHPCRVYSLPCGHIKQSVCGRMDIFVMHEEPYADPLLKQPVQPPWRSLQTRGSTERRWPWGEGRSKAGQRMGCFNEKTPDSAALGI